MEERRLAGSACTRSDGFFVIANLGTSMMVLTSPSGVGPSLDRRPAQCHRSRKCPRHRHRASPSESFDRLSMNGRFGSTNGPVTRPKRPLIDAEQPPLKPCSATAAAVLDAQCPHQSPSTVFVSSLPTMNGRRAHSWRCWRMNHRPRRVRRRAARRRWS